MRSPILKAKNSRLTLVGLTGMAKKGSNNLKSHLDRVINDSEPLIVHRSGNESVVAISLDEYNSMKETEYIMRSPAMMDIIRKGEQDIKEGKGVEFDLSSIKSSDYPASGSY